MSEETPEEVVEDLPEIKKSEVDGRIVDPGVPDGHIEINGEKVVYDYDAEGNLVDWHKEVVA